VLGLRNLPRVRLALAVEGSSFPLAEQHRLVDAARLAEAAGFDYVTVAEHVLMGPHASEQDPWSDWAPEHVDMPWPEPLLTLAAMSAVTTRIGLVSAVVIAPLRPAGLLAKLGATLHALSRGRFVMGVSPSWHRDEYDALGISFAQRGRLMEDAIGACRALWAGAPASFHSPTVNFEGMHCSPRPAPEERIPVWFTGKFTPRLVRRVAALGDGWMPYNAYGMTLPDKAAAIRRLLEAAPRPLLVTETAADLDSLPAVAEAGFDAVRVPLRRFARSADEVPDAIAEIARRFRSAF